MPIDSRRLHTALEMHQWGNVKEALAQYQQLLAEDPANADIWSLAGAALVHLNQFEEAGQYLRRALELHPDHHAAADNLGVLLARQQRYGEAIEYFQRALQGSPGRADTLFNLGSAQLKSGRTQEALVSLREVVRLSPDMLKAHRSLVRLMKEAGDLADALPHLEAVSRLAPDNLEARFELAEAQMQCDRLDAAAATFEEILRRKPDSAEACVNFSHVQFLRKQFDEAARLGRKAVELRPDLAEGYANFGSALAKLAQFAEGETALLQAIRLKPSLTAAYNNLGVAYQDAGEFTKAEACYRKNIETTPADAAAWYNLGLSLTKQRQLTEAIDAYRRAIEIQPNYAEAHHNMSANLLSLGQFEPALPEYEWRLMTKEFAHFRPRWPRYQGEPLAGRTVVLCSEQGLGDLLQFVRYAAVLHERGARVILECPASLHPLLGATAGVDQLITLNTPPPPADFAIPFLSTPLACQTTLETIPARVPYLVVGDDLVEKWKARLSGVKGFRVGIVWQGNPKYPEDRWRSVPLAQFGPLAKVPGVRLISLQKGPGSEQLENLAGELGIVEFADLDAAGGAFMDSAAVMKNLDLVVSTDTAAAHLAGGLGMPIWVALSYAAEWRWMTEREDSPWYPTMRLFREKRWQDWQSVFEPMAVELERLVAKRG